MMSMMRLMVMMVMMVGSESGGGGCTGEDGKRVFPAQGEEAEAEVEDLEDGDGTDEGVEVGGEEVPEQFGPEEGEDGGGDLVEGGGEDEEPGPVVFDQFAHFSPLLLVLGFFWCYW